jgi:hypothetical protein
MIETIHRQLQLATFAGRVGRQQTAVITYLIEENRVLREQLESDGKRRRFTDDQRRRLAAKGKPLGRKVLGTIATIVTPETILAWQRKLIAAADFFTTEVWTVRGLVRHFTLFVIDVATRCVHVAGTTANPDLGVDGPDGPESDGL